MLRLSIQHDTKLQRSTLKATLINSVQAEMNWQNSQLLSRSQAPADPGGQVPKAGLSIQSGRLRPHRTPIPKAGRVAAATPPGTGTGTGPVLRLTLSGPSAPAAARAPRGQAPPPPFSRSSEPGGAFSPPRQRDPRLLRQRAARPRRACLSSPPASRRPQRPHRRARHHLRPGAASRDRLRK